MSQNLDCYIIIPAYNPNNNLIALIKELIFNGFTNIICVDDGSTNGFNFKQLEEFHCVILRHLENKGKGQALKTAFNYILNSNNIIIGGGGIYH